MAKRDSQLMDPEAWDFESAERRPGTKADRTVVSVGFPRKDFELVAEEAERVGMKVSEFIRNAALNDARHQRQQATIFTASGTPGFASFTVTALTSMHAQARVTREHEEQAVTA